MVVFAIVAVFIAGLMVGRTPEYLGKKIEGRDVKFAAIAILILPFVHPRFLGGRGADTGGPGRPVSGPGQPHSLTEILYAFASVTGNNGSAIAGLSGNTIFYNSMLAGPCGWVGISSSSR